MQKNIAILLAFTIPTLSSCISVPGDLDGPYVTVDGDVIRPSGHVASESRTVAPFGNIAVLDGAFDIRVRIGKPQSITVIADDNLTGWVGTSVTDGLLTIESDAPRVKTGSITFFAPRVEIVVPSLQSLKMHGMSDVRVEGLNGGDLTLEVGGSGSVEARGRVDRLQIYLSNFGDAKLFDLEANSAEVSVTGSGRVFLDAREKLRASVTGIGEVSYRGHPKDVSKSVAGNGSIEADEH